MAQTQSPGLPESAGRSCHGDCGGKGSRRIIRCKTWHQTFDPYRPLRWARSLPILRRGRDPGARTCPPTPGRGLRRHRRRPNRPRPRLGCSRGPDGCCPYGDVVSDRPATLAETRGAPQISRLAPAVDRSWPPKARSFSARTARALDVVFVTNRCGMPRACTHSITSAAPQITRSSVYRTPSRSNRIPSGLSPFGALISVWTRALYTDWTPTVLGGFLASCHRPAGAAAGLYAAVCYAMERRLGEFGLRMAVGARSPQIAALVLRLKVAPQKPNELLPHAREDLMEPVCLSIQRSHLPPRLHFGFVRLRLRAPRPKKVGGNGQPSRSLAAKSSWSPPARRWSEAGAGNSSRDT